MIISIITCMDINNAIGKNNELPWGKEFKQDLEFFKKTTYNYPVIMGKNTYLSIGKPLKNRLNCIITKDKKIKNDTNLIKYNNLPDCLNFLLNSLYSKVFIIGGSQLYEQGILYADNLYITKIEYTYKNCDTFFPKFDKNKYKEKLLIEDIFDNKKFTIKKYSKI